MMHTNSLSTYLLEGLSEQDSFSLFVKSAFEEGEERKHPQLLEIGREIVKNCVGVPLAVRTLGSSLISKVDRNEWESVRDNALWSLSQNEKDILPALHLSYDKLPSYLKRCFASFSLFFRNSQFNTFNVVMLWEALGYLPPPKESETVNDVANQFLRELWSRSFLTDFIDLGSTCRFKLHDLVHDLVVYVAKGEFQIVYPHSPKISEHAQHLQFIGNDLLGQALLPTDLRTIIFPNHATNEDLLNTVVSRCKYLRFLYLANSEYECFPNCIGKLKHLRYLALTGCTELKRLPDSVCKLQNLKFLGLNRCTNLQQLPKGIGQLVSLRQLLITTRQSDFPEKEIASLTSLELLKFYNCVRLESLSIGIQLSRLKSLILIGFGSLKSLSFHARAIRNLESLGIMECGELELSMGLADQIPDLRLKLLHLGKLQQLVTVPQWLQGSVNTLHSLLITNCNNLVDLPEWLSTMISLKVLKIDYCAKLRSLPDMHHLTNLENLEINGCPELWKRFQPELGQDWHKISHIKKVIIRQPEE